MSADPNRVPWGNMYEFTISGTFVVALRLPRALPPVLAWRGWARWSSAAAVTLLMVAVIWLYDPVGPLPDALDSPWLVIHVVSAILATGAFTVGGLVSVVYLVKARRGADGAVLSRVPGLDVLDRVAYRIHAFAFPVWTFAVLITGPIWAHQAWSSYWNWDPKEVWAFITWVVYAAYLHARTTAGWKGRNAAILALVGTATLWFNFIGINYFSSSSQHSYADAAPAPVESPSVLEVVLRRVAVGEVPASSGEVSSCSSTFAGSTCSSRARPRPRRGRVRCAGRALLRGWWSWWPGTPPASRRHAGQTAPWSSLIRRPPPASETSSRLVSCSVPRAVV